MTCLSPLSPAPLRNTCCMNAPPPPAPIATVCSSPLPSRPAQYLLQLLVHRRLAAHLRPAMLHHPGEILGEYHAWEGRKHSHCWACSGEEPALARVLPAVLHRPGEELGVARTARPGCGEGRTFAGVGWCAAQLPARRNASSSTCTVPSLARERQCCILTIHLALINKPMFMAGSLPFTP